MRENRSYGLEGGESGSTGLPYPYRGCGWFGFLGRSHLSPDGGGFLAPPSTAWQRVATGVRVVWFPGRSHLSPDGGGLSRAAVDRLAAGGYGVFTRNRSLPTMELKE